MFDAFLSLWSLIEFTFLISIALHVTTVSSGSSTYKKINDLQIIKILRNNTPNLIFVFILLFLEIFDPFLERAILIVLRDYFFMK